MRRIQLEAALAVLDRLGFYPRDIGLFDSALERPVTSVYGEFVYQSIAVACAAQTESLAQNQALINGNKRTALVLLSVFLRINGYKHTMPTQIAFQLMVGFAEGTITLEESAKTISEYLVPWGRAMSLRYTFRPEIFVV